MRSIALLASAAWLVGGCATAPATFTWRPGPVVAEEVTWPAAPEVPRYRFEGELLGDGNYVRTAPQRSLLVRAMRAVVGLDEPEERPRVLVRPQSGMVGTDGRVFVADAGRGGVFVFDPNGGDLAFWGQADRGAAFAAPVGIATGPGGEILVADPELHRVVRLDRAGRALGAFGEGVLQRPTGLAHDASLGLVYVADTATHTVRVFDRHYRLIRTLGGPGTEAGRFNRPTFVALHGSDLVVSDTLNARVQVLSAEGEPRRVIGRRGIYVGDMVRPKGVAVDRDGNVYVVEGYHDHLLVFDTQGRLLLPIGGAGAGPGRFFLPGGVWSDGADRIFLADVFNGRVVVFRHLGASP